MMNYSKNMKRFLSRNRYYIALFVIVAVLIITIVACSKGSGANDVHTVEPIVTNTPTEPVVTEPVITEPETTKEPEPEYISLGEFKVTAYCGCSKCCGKWGENRPVDSDGKIIVMTAGGYRAVQGVTIAADTSKFPFGTKLFIDGHEYTVQDRGGAINGNKLDIYFNNHQDALNFGVQYKEVFIQKGGETND